MPDDLLKKLPKFGKINLGPLKNTSAKKQSEKLSTFNFLVIELTLEIVSLNVCNKVKFF